MSNNNLKCKNCGSNNLIYYCEKIMTEYKNVNKNGTMSKKVSKISKWSLDNYVGSTGVICKNCLTVYDYTLDNNGKIIALKSNI